MERIYSSMNINEADAFQAYAAVAQREFYDADFSWNGNGYSDLDLAKCVSAPVSITRISTGTEFSFRRGPQHIRKNRVGLRVIWFVRRGSARIANTNGSFEIPEGSAMIIDSNHACTGGIKGDETHRHESVMMTLPPDVFYRHLLEAERLAVPFSLVTDEGRAVNELLEVLVQHGDRFGEKTSTQIVTGLLDAIADFLRDSKIDLPRRQKLVDRRLADIENYIMRNLTDSELCYDKVAASCGISPRYLCYILKANNTSFSELVWKNRLLKARDWLVSLKTRDLPIHEIAYKSGFKSAAHFSRMFKNAYGLPPREYRALHESGDLPLAEEMADVVFLPDQERKAA